MIDFQLVTKIGWLFLKWIEITLLVFILKRVSLAINLNNTYNL